MEEELLQGGITNAGAVVRSGRDVLRPPSTHWSSIHAFLLAVRTSGFEGAPMPVGIDADGRERLEFIEGDVPVAPYPDWAQSDAALASIARLVRDLHDASRGFDPSGLDWTRELADPAGGTQICHNDLELSNIVFKDGTAVALIDFEFAAPGRPIYDLAQFARLCVPIEHEIDQARMGWASADRPARLRLIADEYGLDQKGRMALLPAVTDALDQIEQFALRRAHMTDPMVLEMTGGLEKYNRRRDWWHRHYTHFADALR